MTTLTIRNVTASYVPATPVIHDLSLTVASGERFVLVGPSGCGKTTLLRCIDGLIPLTDGHVEVNGNKITSPPADMAMVFQHFGLFPWKTVVDNVAYGLKLAGVKRAEAKASNAKAEKVSEKDAKEEEAKKAEEVTEEAAKPETEEVAAEVKEEAVVEQAASEDEAKKENNENETKKD